VTQAWLICQVVTARTSSSTEGSPIISRMRGTTVPARRSGSPAEMS
jgi:hypothetical protein